MNEKILVIGGAFQGKLDFVCRQFSILKDQVISESLPTGQNYHEYKVLNGFHLIMKKWIEDNRDPDDLTELIMNGTNPMIIISDEVGRGLVPLIENERYCREQTGRALCKIAAQAAIVYRVHCGLADRIK